jgi:hypothetical protein
VKVGTNVPAELTANAAVALHVMEKFPDVPGSKTVFAGVRSEQLLFMTPEAGCLIVVAGTV